MYTLAIFLSFCSIWSLFAAADKVEFAKTKMTLTLSKKTKVTKMVALVAFLGATGMLSYLLGPVVGILSSCVLWMILASLIVLFAPFPNLRFIHLSLLFGLLFGIDMLFTYIL